MANFCDFEFRVRGKKKAVKAFYESTPYMDWKDAEYEGGTDSNYEMHFKGNCKWSINFDVEDDCDGVTVDLSKHSLSQIEELGAEYVGYSVRAKSEIFQCEVKVHYWSMESEFDQFDHYKNGECLKKRKIAFDNYGEEENFDWDTLEFIGHEGEYDESVDGEQSDIELMNMLRMMPGVSVPSQKPKKKVNSSVGVTSSSKKATTPFKGIKITRDKNNVVKGKGYTYVVPDGFRVGKEDGRDFIAWLPGSSSSSIDDAKIRIYPPNKNMQFGNGEEGLGGLLEYFQKSPQLCDAYQDYMCQLTKTQNPLGFKLNYEYFPTVLSYTSGGCMYNRTSGYYTFLVKVLIGEHFEQFRFDVVGVTASNESAAQDLVRELADGIIPNKSFNLPEPLNGEKYRSATLTAGVVKEWSENFNSQLGLQAAVRNIRQKAIEEKIKFMASEGDIDRDIIVDDIRRMSREYLDVVVKLVEEAIDIIGFFSRQGANKAQVTKLRNETVEYLDNNNEISVNLDGEAIREEIKQLRDLKERIAHAEDFNSTVSSQKTPIERSIPEETTTYSEPKSEIGNDELDAKILDLLKNGEKYAVKELRTGDEIIESLSPQRLSAALRRMTQAGSLIKVDENGDSYYYSNKALYDKAAKAFNGAKTVEKYEELIKTFNLLGGHQDARAYVEKCREQIKEINYDAANKLMLSAKTPNDFKKAVDAFKKLGSFRESEANLTLCNTKKQELENSNSYDAAVKKMNDAKTSAEIAKVVSLFEALGSYRDSKELAQKCKEKSNVLKEEERKQSVYNQAIAKIASSDIAVLTQAATELDTIAGWRDTDIQAHRIRAKIAEIVAEKERQRIETAKKKKKAKIITTLTLIGMVALIAFIIVFVTVPKPSMHYNKAINLMSAGNVKAAADLFVELDDYKDSKKYLDAMCQNNPTLKFYIANVGDTVTIGTYDHGDGNREIEWYVLSKQGNKVLLISKYILDASESSGMDSWITDFNKSAFSSAEKEYSNAVLLNIYDANRYTSELSEEVKSIVQTSPTARAKANGIESHYNYVSGKSTGYSWWLSGSSNGRDDLIVYANRTYVPSPNGIVDSASDGSICGLRPCAWIELE